MRFIVFRHEIISGNVSCLSTPVKMAKCTPVQYGITADQFAQACRNISPRPQLIFVRPVMTNGNSDQIEPSVTEEHRGEKIDGESTSLKPSLCLPLGLSGGSHFETDKSDHGAGETWTAIVARLESAGLI